eukprot:12923-Heterococcus_DN1.PRE.6
MTARELTRQSCNLSSNSRKQSECMISEFEVGASTALDCYLKDVAPGNYPCYYHFDNNMLQCGAQ